MLSASALLGLPSAQAFDTVPAAISTVEEHSFGARDQTLAISAIHFLIDGQEVTRTSLDQPLQMEVGASLQIVGIDYRLQGEETITGKIAFEGYLNKLRGSRVRTDYGDGRFGGHEQEGELPFGGAAHAGLNDAWKMTAGTESLTLVMVRYSEDGATVEDRLNIQTQVGTPDFVIHPEIKIKGSNKGVVAGRQVRIIGSWANEGTGTYRNYAEVDIYHESDPTKPVWVGTLADVVEADESDSGEFVNKVRRDGFSKRWIPQLGGTYTLKFHADPENRWAESNEDNNVLTLELEVRDQRNSVRGRDALNGYGFNHHSVNDTNLHHAALAAYDLADSAPASPTTLLTANTDVIEQVDENVVIVTPLATSGTTHEDTAQPKQATSEHQNNTNAGDEAWTQAIDQLFSLPLI